MVGPAEHWGSGEPIPEKEGREVATEHAWCGKAGRSWSGLILPPSRLGNHCARGIDTVKSMPIQRPVWSLPLPAVGGTCPVTCQSHSRRVPGKHTLCPWKVLRGGVWVVLTARKPVWSHSVVSPRAVRPQPAPALCELFSCPSCGVTRDEDAGTEDRALCPMLHPRLCFLGLWTWGFPQNLL